MWRPENDLAVLRIRLDRRGRARTDGYRNAAVVFEVVVRSDEVREVSRIAPADLDLPEAGISGTRHDLPVTLPTDTRDALRAALAGRDAIWLELPAPGAPLRPLPWEAALEPLGIPVLRLPYFALRPREKQRGKVVAVCASSPMAKAPIGVAQEVAWAVEAVNRASDFEAEVHVFVDEQWFPEVSHLGSLGGAFVHDPGGTADYALPVRRATISEGAGLGNPWLLWIRDALAGRAVDHVHFCCHGYFAADRGAVALASSPLVNTDRRLSRFVGAPELMTLLAAVGASSVGFTGPPDNYSPLGLRALADAIAEARPVTVLANQTELGGPFTDELVRALTLAIGEARAAPPLPHSALWIHPQRLTPGASYPTGESAANDELLGETSQSVLLEPATIAALAAPNTPAWVASGVRVLEQAQAKWLSPTQTGLNSVESVRTPSSPATDALRILASILEAHVREAGGQS